MNSERRNDDAFASGFRPQASVHPNARIGTNAILHSYAVVEAGAILGDDVVADSGAHIAADVTVGHRVRIGANAVLMSDIPGTGISIPSVIADDAQIGANATILPGVTVGSKAIVRPGSVVSRSVPPTAIVEGNPAAIVAYVDANRSAMNAMIPVATAGSDSVSETSVRNVTVHRFPVIKDMRGNLTVAEIEKHLPFLPRRYFMISCVPNREIRGEHAHRKCHQFLVCTSGSCSVVADDGHNRIEVTLDAPNTGLYLPPMTWAIQYKYTADALLLVLASDPYDPADYIRDYSEFIREAVSRNS